MNTDCSVVMTSIAGPENPVLRSYARQCGVNGVPFIVIGDSKSPRVFCLDKCDFWGLDRQRGLPFELARLLPENTYARKNIGYLIAMSNSSEIIIEIDDDTLPKPGFWHERSRLVTAKVVENAGWVNVYRCFTHHHIWPRGFPVEKLHGLQGLGSSNAFREIQAPIRQGLADDDPDVDAIYRLALPLPMTFDRARPVALGINSWCPFNSQNTTWFREAFPLLYLPSHCSFRMTDIWRSLIAQRIAWTCGWYVVFDEATVNHERNAHDLLKDFSDEVAGYLNNGRIAENLRKLDLKPGLNAIIDNLIACYTMMIDQGHIGIEEMGLLNAWINDYRAVLP
jgi:STELLO glycosyltransferases